MTQQPKKVFAVVLAAGASQRFGATKLLAPFHGRPLIQIATEAATQACGEQVVLVTAPSSFDCVVSASRSCRFFLINDDASDGLGTSISAATRAMSSRCDALLFLLADQPLVTGEHLRAILRRWAEKPGAIVATRFADTMGPPVLFPRAAFGALQVLRGDQGARTLLEGSQYDVTSIRFDAAAIDIDTPDDLANFAR